MEIWKDIYYFDCIKNEWVDYRGLYQVSSEGRVKSLERLNSKGCKVKERILKTSYNNRGYLLVKLYKNKKGKNLTVHRLVAQMFIENDDKINKKEVNHKDENKMNNDANNLEWSTREFNVNYGTRNERASEKVICITTGEIYDSITEASRQTGVAIPNISANCRGRIKSAGKDENGNKMVWRYYDEYLESL